MGRKESGGEEKGIAWEENANEKSALSEDEGGNTDIASRLHHFDRVERSARGNKMPHRTSVYQKIHWVPAYRHPESMA